MSHDTLNDEQLDEQDILEADDTQYHRSRSSRNDTLRLRRQVEALLEERRLKRAIEDDWDLEEE
ncbi:PA3496 family putative envelope integrity protein [Halomonas sp. GXIMD04776]|uniref:PA3496 family putative envelope integrity protein n=1 Tax=Halomonas sp. GXIMD04776 TaxID=3415605 RepID=UPI003CB821AA